MDSLAKYSFIPWLRQGIANKIVEQDSLGEPNSNDDYYVATERPELLVGISLNSIEVRKKIKLHGPGDIMGIQHDAVLKVHPVAGTQDFESNALPYIEFYEEDFPWRYTPAIRVESDKRLRPWLFLIVAKEGEYDFHNDGNGLPYVSIKSGYGEKVFPSHLETWAWAHVHVNHSLTAGNIKNSLKAELDNNPDVAYSRLICPRRLERTGGGVKYHAFLIPTFETGRLAGLGEDPKDIIAQKSSWTFGGHADSDIRPHDFPVYYNWEFKTGQYGDFETLVKILKSRPLGEGFGKRDMNISMPGMGLNKVATSKTLGFEGALKPPSFSRGSWPKNIGDTIFKEELKNILNIPQDIQEESGNKPANPYYDSADPNVFYSGNVVDDPIVTPPIYGKWHALAKKVSDPNNPEWIHQLNLDPRNRAVASIGTQIVRKYQEKFMEMAWQQIGEVNEANQKIREAELAKMVNNALYEKHYTKLDDDQLLLMTSAAHKHILIPDNNKSSSNAARKTFEARLSETRIPNAARSAAFKKIIRPGKKIIRKINNKGDDDAPKVPIHKSLMANFNEENEEKALTAAKKKITPIMAVPTTDVQNAINYFLDIQATEAQQNENLQLDPEIAVSQELFAEDFMAFSTNISNLQIVQTPPIIDNLVNFTSNLLTQFNPMLTIANYVTPMIISGSNTIEKVKPIMAYPEIPDPMFFYLQNLSQDFIIPNIREIPENTITLLENNQVFIEAFMAGLNHEMSKELLWREYPTDQRGSYFRNFWDDKDSLSTADDNDILPMDKWDGALGSHNQRINNADGSSEQKKNFIVLVMRGDLLKKYPNTVIFAQKAVLSNSGPARTLSDSNNPDNIKTPIFQAELEPDIAMYAFSLTKEEARGNADYPQGWFFVMQERPGEITFGLDDSPEIPNEYAQQWNDLEWGHLVPENGSLDNLNHIPCTSIRATATSPKWGTNSAEMAYILYQMPVIFARHAREMLP
jgi:hypothetical protein